MHNIIEIIIIIIIIIIITIFDIHVIDARSYVSRSVQSVLESAEREKKKYNEAAVSHPLLHLWSQLMG